MCVSLLNTQHCLIYHSMELDLPHSTLIIIKFKLYCAVGTRKHLSETLPKMKIDVAFI